MNTPKVFAIGFQKTGTSSLGKALEILGYRVSGYSSFRDYASHPHLTYELLLNRAVELVEQYDAFQDTPWPVLYQELDQKYPGSKFILVVRNTDDWIRSVVKDFSHYPNAIHELIYGVPFPEGHESIWIERYEKHNNDVKNYFKNRPNDLLVMNLNNGETCWENLAPFVGKDIPKAPWPHTNKSMNKKIRMFWSRNWQKIKNLFSRGSC